MNYSFHEILNGFLWANGQEASNLLPVNSLVEVVGLEKRLELNWHIARVVAYDESAERYDVRFEGTHFEGFVAKIKLQHLVPFKTDMDDIEANFTVGAIPWHGRESCPMPHSPDIISLSRIHEALRRSTSRRMSRTNAAARIISIAQQNEERRNFMAACILELRAVGANCEFRDAIVGKDLPFSESELQGSIHQVHLGGVLYTIDTSAWPCDGWTEDRLAVVRHGFERMRFYPHYWTAISRNVQDSQTLGFVGGHMSHVSVWRETYEQQWDWVLVIEDDALPAPTLRLSWADIWHILVHEISGLAKRNEEWDILYVGRTLSMTPEGRRVSGLLCEPGYCLRTHSYCLSRRGLERLLNSGISHTVLHCPQDEIFATLCVKDHVWPDALSKISTLMPQEGWRALAIRWRGLTAQLMDVEQSNRAASRAAAHA